MADPIRFPGCLPEGALILPDHRPAKPTPSPAPAVQGTAAPVWLSCDHAPEDAPLRLWPASTGQIAAAVPANETGTARLANGTLIFRAGENSGLCLPEALPKAEKGIIAVIFRPMSGASGGSILSLQPTDGSGYLFLAHEDGQLRIGRKDADLSLTVPAPDGVILAGLILAQDKVALMVNGRIAGSSSLSLTGPADLFIGCRTARPGLKNKLGSFHLFDVLLWPDAERPDLGAALALRAERGRHGV